MIGHQRPPEHELDEALRPGAEPVHAKSESPAFEPSVFDRRFDVSRISIDALAWAALLVIAFLVRIVELTKWPLSAGEARIASDALALLQGDAFSSDPSTHPLPVALVALGIFLFGATDAIVRLIPAGLGIGTILLLIPARAWLGRSPALGAAFMMALSPTMVFASRTAGAGSLMVAGILLLLVVLVRSAARPGYGSAVVVGAAGAFLPLSGPLGWVALPLALVTVPAVTGRWLPHPGAIPAVLLGFLTTIIVVSTSLFTRPAGFTGFVNASLSELWSNHLSSVGAGWFLIPIELVTYELLPLVFGIYTVCLIVSNSGRLTSSPERLARAVVAWMVLAGIATMLLAGKSPDLYCLIVLPLALLAGIGLGLVADAVKWRILHRRGAWFLVALLLTVAAAGVFGLLLGNTDFDALRLGITLVAIALLILVSLILFAWSTSRGVNRLAGPLAVLVLVVLLGAVELRTSLLLASTDLDRPGELLLAGSTAADVAFVVERLHRLSLDLTATNADVRDPTGGHGLTIAIERTIAQPFIWYLRGFPNVTVVEPDARLSEPVGYQAIIARPEVGPDLVPRNAGYVQRSYDFTVPLAFAFDGSPSVMSSAEEPVNPGMMKRFVDFVTDRERTASPERPQFDLALRAELAARVYGNSTPLP